MVKGLNANCSSRPGAASYVSERVDLLLSGPGLNDLLQSVLEKGGSFHLRAVGFSMAPFVQDGDVVTIAPLPNGGPCLGDIVAFRHPQHGKLTIHRVVRRQSDAWLIRGDNIAESDGLVPRTHILGRITHVSRAGRRARLSLGPERVLIALLSRCGLLLLVWRMARVLSYG